MQPSSDGFACVQLSYTAKRISKSFHFRCLPCSFRQIKKSVSSFLHRSKVVILPIPLYKETQTPASVLFLSSKLLSPIRKTPSLRLSRHPSCEPNQSFLFFFFPFLSLKSKKLEPVSLNPALFSFPPSAFRYNNPIQPPCMSPTLSLASNLFVYSPPASLLSPLLLVTRVPTPPPPLSFLCFLGRPLVCSDLGRFEKRWRR